jgi:hypothetical protein
LAWGFAPPRIHRREFIPDPFGEAGGGLPLWGPGALAGGGTSSSWGASTTRQVRGFRVEQAEIRPHSRNIRHEAGGSVASKRPLWNKRLVFIVLQDKELVECRY